VNPSPESCARRNSSDQTTLSTKKKKKPLTTVRARYLSGGLTRFSAAGLIFKRPSRPTHAPDHIRQYQPVTVPRNEAPPTSVNPAGSRRSVRSFYNSNVPASQSWCRADLNRRSPPRRLQNLQSHSYRSGSKIVLTQRAHRRRSGATLF